MRQRFSKLGPRVTTKPSLSSRPLSEVVNPLPFSQQDLRDGPEFGVSWFTKTVRRISRMR